MDNLKDVDVSNLKLIAQVFERYQDERRASSKDTNHLSEAQQDLSKVITVLEENQ